MAAAFDTSRTQLFMHRRIMTKTAIRRTLAVSVPAAFIAATTFAGAATTASISHATLARPVLGAQPNRQVIRPFANPTKRSTFVAGGATLPALAYEGSSATSNNPSLPTTGSIFEQLLNVTGVSVQYCQTGSGFGRKTFEGDPGSGGVNAQCLPLGSTFGSTDGFGAPANLGLTDPDITGTDVPMAQSDYSEYVTNKAATRGEPVSEPSIIGSVALFYNNTNTGVTSQLNLTEKQLCGLVSGTITNWKQLSPAYNNEPLFFVYRSDGSGTTFSFSNHIQNSAVCPGNTFNVSQNFTAPSGTVSVVGPTPPVNFVGESGNVGVATEIVNNPGYIGYVESANALAFKSGSTNYSKLGGKDPIKNLPETAAAFKDNANDVALDSVVNTFGGAAQVATLSPAPAKAGCVLIAIPSSYSNITAGYPIIAVTNLLMSTTGNGPNHVQLQDLITILNSPGDFSAGNITTVDKATKTAGTGTTGYSALGASFNTQLKSIATTCIHA
jgi:phosphate transport system substrate-binding protein